MFKEISEVSKGSSALSLYADNYIKLSDMARDTVEDLKFKLNEFVKEELGLRITPELTSQFMNGRFYEIYLSVKIRQEETDLEVPLDLITKIVELIPFPCEFEGTTRSDELKLIFWIHNGAELEKDEEAEG